MMRDNEPKELWEMGATCAKSLLSHFVQMGLPFPGKLVIGPIDMTPSEKEYAKFTMSPSHKGWYEIAIRNVIKTNYGKVDTSPFRVTFPIVTDSCEEMDKLVKEALRPIQLSSSATPEQVLSCIQWHKAVGTDLPYTLICPRNDGRWLLCLDKDKDILLDKEWPDDAAKCIVALERGELCEGLKTVFPKQSPWVLKAMDLPYIRDYPFSEDASPDFFVDFVRYAWHTWNNGGQFHLPQVSVTLDEGGMGCLQYGGPRSGGLRLAADRSSRRSIGGRLCPMLSMHAQSTHVEVLTIIFGHKVPLTKRERERLDRESYGGGHRDGDYGWSWLEKHEPAIYAMCQTSSYQGIGCLLAFMGNIIDSPKEGIPYQYAFLGDHVIIYGPEGKEEYSCPTEAVAKLLCMCANRKWQGDEEVFLEWKKECPWADRWIPAICHSLQPKEQRKEKWICSIPIDGVMKAAVDDMQAWSKVF